MSPVTQTTSRDHHGKIRVNSPQNPLNRGQERGKSGDTGERKELLLFTIRTGCYAQRGTVTPHLVKKKRS